MSNQAATGGGVTYYAAPYSNTQDNAYHYLLIQ